MRETLRVINRMRRDGVIGEYAIGGAVAAGMWLEPFTTKDLDVFVELPVTPGTGLLSLSAIYHYLNGHGYKPHGQYIEIGDWPVEFLHPASDLEREAIEESAELTIEGVRVRVIRAEHLVAISLKTARAKDHARILMFLEQQRADLRKLRTIIVRFGLERQWQEFIDKFSPDDYPRNPDKARLRERRRKMGPSGKAMLIEQLRDAGTQMRKARSRT